MTLEQIKELVIEFPNDMELGEAVRRLYWKTKETTTVIRDSNQMDLFDDGDNRDDVAILGED